MTELVTQDNLLVHPISGEVKELAELTEGEIRDGVEQLQELAQLVAIARKQLAREAWDRKNKGQAPSGLEISRKRDWSVGDAAAALGRLIHDGVIPESCREYVYNVESHKANGRSLNALVDTLVAEDKLDAAKILLSARRDSLTVKPK